MRFAFHPLFLFSVVVFLATFDSVTTNPLQAQRPVPNKLLSGGHDLQNGYMPPGVIGQQRMLTRPEMHGYMQPIRFEIPDGANIEVWDGTQYLKMDEKTPVANMLVGAVYRLKVTNIPKRAGSEVYPSIEIINRLFPPQGKAAEFPVVVHISQSELEKAINGKYVSRVTYLEDPETALPFQQTKGDQAYFQVGVNEDPLKVAAGLGRPMTIVRMGSRVPLNDNSGAFELGNAPVNIPGNDNGFSGYPQPNSLGASSGQQKIQQTVFEGQKQQPATTLATTRITSPLNNPPARPMGQEPERHLIPNRTKSNQQPIRIRNNPYKN